VNSTASDEVVVWMTGLWRGMILTFAMTLVMLWVTVEVVFVILGHGVGDVATLARGIAWPTAEGALLWVSLGAWQRRAVHRLAAAAIQDRP
jgi:hypothetical protein